jgi:hypothetical protein
MKKILSISLVVLLAGSLFFTLSIKPVLAYSGTTQIFFGAFVGPSHKVAFSYIQDFENQVGKNVSIWNWIQLWNRPPDGENNPNFKADWMNEARNHGAIPMVSWSPEASDNDPNFVNLQSILNGKEDAYLTAWGQASAAWGHPYFVRLMWEFTGSWTNNTPQQPGYGIYPWGNGNTPEKFVQAWQYIVDKVRAAGGTQISWIWCPGDVGDSVSTLRSLYPGDNYVDWVGTDIYLRSGQTFAQGAQPELPNIRSVAPNKPVMLPEIGYIGGDSASYWANLLTNVLPNDYSYIKGICLWQDPAEGLTVTDSAILPSFREAIASNYYSSNIYSSLSTSPIPAIGSTTSTLPSITPFPSGQPIILPTPSPSTTVSTVAPSNVSFNVQFWILFAACLIVVLTAAIMKKRRF